MRTRPKVALLIFITLWFGFARATPRPIGEVVTERLRERLVAYYAVGELSFGNEALLDDSEFLNFTAVPLMLAEVIRHADDPSILVQGLNEHVIARAAHLTMTEGPRPELKFLTTQLTRQLGQLLDRFESDREQRLGLVMMFDKLDLWSAAQLPFLVRQAGSDDEYDAATFAKIVENILFLNRESPTYLQMTNEMAKVIRAAETRSSYQWALLARSGHASNEELATMLLLIAHEYASSIYPSDISPLQMGHPVRAAIQYMMEDFEDEDPDAEDVFARASARSEESRDLVSPLVIRRQFFNEFVDGTLLGGKPRPVVDVDARANDNQVGGPRGGASSKTPVEREGNIIRTPFRERTSGGCEDDIVH